VPYSFHPPDSLGVSPCLETDGRDGDESGSLARLESTHLIHAGELLVVQSLVGGPSLDNTVALVELELDGSVDGPLTGRDSSGNEFALGGEEVSVVEDSGKLDRNELIPQSTDISVQSHSLEIHVSHTQDGSSGRLVTTTRLDSNESVLDNVDSANTVLPGKSVQSQEDIDSISVDSTGSGNGDLYGKTSREFDLDLLGLIRSVFRRSGQLPHISGRGGVGVLQDTGLVGNVEQVLVGGPWLGSGLDDGDTVLSGVVEKSGSTGEPVVEFCGRKMAMSTCWN
jgi:hypothetical protein